MGERYEGKIRGMTKNEIEKKIASLSPEGKIKYLTRVSSKESLLSPKTREGVYLTLAKLQSESNRPIDVAESYLKLGGKYVSRAVDYLEQKGKEKFKEAEENSWKGIYTMSPSTFNQLGDMLKRAAEIAEKTGDRKRAKELFKKAAERFGWAYSNFLGFQEGEPRDEDTRIGNRFVKKQVDCLEKAGEFKEAADKYLNDTDGLDYTKSAQLYEKAWETNSSDNASLNKAIELYKETGNLTAVKRLERYLHKKDIRRRLERGKKE